MRTIKLYNLIATIRHSYLCLLLTKTNAARNEVALIYQKVRGLYILAVVFGVTICLLLTKIDDTVSNPRCNI